jgi:hypothetical protein
MLSPQGGIEDEDEDEDENDDENDRIMPPRG